MSPDLRTILVEGAAALAAGVCALTLLLRRDFAGVLARGGGAPFLGFGLGLGLIAFTIKLAAIVTLANLPPGALAALASPSPPRAAQSGVATDTVLIVDPPRWRALPREAPAPADNPTTIEKATLGRRLFEDPRLSSNGAVSCAACHDVNRAAGADGRARSIGVTGVPGKRNAPSVFNAGFQARLFWDGRASSLEEQALGPLVNPDEMGMPSLEAVEQRVAADPDYRAAFAHAFGSDEPITIEVVAKAIAAYERTLVTPDAPYDRFVEGDDAALTGAQKRGMELFRGLGSSICHAGANFSGASLIDVRRPYAALRGSRSPLAARYGLAGDKGRADGAAENGVWRIPSLGNVTLTALYFHNGSAPRLAEAVRAMAALQTNAILGEAPPELRLAVGWSNERRQLSTYRRRVVSDEDIADLVAFLGALTSDRLAAAVAARP